MRGEDLQQHELFSYGSLEERVPADHPLRPIRGMDEALKDLDVRFDEIYGEDGRRSIPPERLLRALLLQMLYSVRSERMLMEQWNITFCSAGSWGSQQTSRYGIQRYSRKIGTVCWKVRLPRSSSG